MKTNSVKEDLKKSEERSECRSSFVGSLGENLPF
jgi:hypothetical protein